MRERTVNTMYISTGPKRKPIKNIRESRRVAIAYSKVSYHTDSHISTVGFPAIFLVFMSCPYALGFSGCEGARGVRVWLWGAVRAVGRRATRELSAAERQEDLATSSKYSTNDGRHAETG